MAPRPARSYLPPMCIAGWHRRLARFSRRGIRLDVSRDGASDQYQSGGPAQCAAGTDHSIRHLLAGRSLWLLLETMGPAPRLCFLRLSRGHRCDWRGCETAGVGGSLSWQACRLLRAGSEHVGGRHRDAIRTRARHVVRCANRCGDARAATYSINKDRAEAAVARLVLRQLISVLVVSTRFMGMDWWAMSCARRSSWPRPPRAELAHYVK